MVSFFIGIRLLLCMISCVSKLLLHIVHVRCRLVPLVMVIIVLVELQCGHCILFMGMFYLGCLVE
jgi:hypothetical protein